MPSYGDFYDHRSELYSFTIKIEQGLDGVKPASKVFSRKWSMADVTWVDDSTVAVKVYSNTQPADKDYKYYLVEL
ncbi:hypothetical protein GCM10023184_28080 [Flaviaesturariibacter amylovorans]|uniref:Uncharacterized protein n=1 Tax=Flaviaesturariibacter amylovorans TaxID=1084520 RepID=A0ABP8H4H2_9BACT